MSCLTIGHRSKRLAAPPRRLISFFSRSTRFSLRCPFPTSALGSLFDSTNHVPAPPTQAADWTRLVESAVLGQLPIRAFVACTVPSCWDAGNRGADRIDRETRARRPGDGLLDGKTGRGRRRACAVARNARRALDSG